MPSVALGSAFLMSLLLGSRASSSIQADLRVVGKGPTPGEHFPAWASGYVRLCPQAAARGLSLHRSRLHFGGHCHAVQMSCWLSIQKEMGGGRRAHTWPSVCSHTCVSVQLLSWVALRCFL